MNIVFAENIDKEKILNSNKYLKFIESISNKKDILKMDILLAKFDLFNKLERLNILITYKENEIERQELFIMAGGKMFFFLIIVEEETDQKYVLIEKCKNEVLSKQYNNILSFDIIDTDIKSNILNILNTYFGYDLFDPKFNELNHLTTGLLNSSFSDSSLSIFAYETILTSKYIQDIFNEFNGKDQLEICRFEDFINKIHTIEGKIAYFSYQDIYINSLKLNYEKKQRSNTDLEIKTIELIKNAINNDFIVSLYQPIIQNNTERVVRYESLIRIRDKDNEFIMPDKFLPVAIKNDLYTQLTSLVIDQAIKLLSVNYFSIVINLNSIDLASTKIKQKIYKLLESNTNDKNSKIIFELNEDQEYLDFGSVITFIKRVKKYGAKIGIDDYGISDRGLHKMLDLNPDFIKLRRHLIVNLQKDILILEETQKIIHFAKSNNIQTIAPYIETEELFNLTKGLGVDFSQGFYFGRAQELNF